MNVFVSYTRRDGVITLPLLVRLHSHLEKVCKPFIHAIEEPTLSNQQMSVVLALMRSSFVILLTSPEVYRSPWIRFELLLAKVLFRPVLLIDGDRSTPPTIGVVIRLVDSLVLELRTGKGLVIHCRAGIGRSGMIAACVLLRLGMPFGEVFPVLSRARRVPVPDTEAQVAWVKNFDRELRLRRNG